MQPIEAIDIIKRMFKGCPTDQQYEALDMAYTALANQTSNTSNSVLTKPVIVQAIEHDGLKTRQIAIELKVRPDMKQDDILNAIKQASLEYCLTKEGKDTYSYNCNNFNYGDFSTYVPNDICTKYGICKANIETDTFSVIFDEQLVSETDVLQETENKTINTI